VAPGFIDIHANSLNVGRTVRCHLAGPPIEGVSISTKQTVDGHHVRYTESMNILQGRSGRLFISLMTTCCLLLQPVAGHEIHFTNHLDKPILSLKVPEGWTVTFDKEKLFFVSPNAESRIIAWKIPVTENREEAEFYLQTLFDTILISPKLVKAEETFIGNIPTKLAVATGQPSLAENITGEDTTLTALILEPDPGTYFVVISTDSNSSNEVAPTLMNLVRTPNERDTNVHNP
jgi:hypothetical protein